MLVIGLAYPSASQTGGDAVTVRVDRWLEVQQLQLPVTYFNNSTSRTARRGDRLKAVGEGLITGADAAATLAVDTGIGTVEMAADTHLEVAGLSTTASGGRITQLQVDRGRVRLQVRPFTNPDTRFEIQTPAGVSGVRGTEFGVIVFPDGKMGVATLEGNVATEAQGQAVEVPAGFQNVTIPGEPPSEPVPFTNEPRLDYQAERVVRRGIRRIIVNGQVDPTSSVLIKGEPQAIDRDGKFSLLLPAPNRLRLAITVVTPLGQTQTYDLDLI
ncbi:MAG: FecR domain-containing protein [Elainella sp.]